MGECAIIATASTPMRLGQRVLMVSDGRCAEIEQPCCVVRRATEAEWRECWPGTVVEPYEYFYEVTTD